MLSTVLCAQQHHHQPILYLLFLVHANIFHSFCHNHHNAIVLSLPITTSLICYIVPSYHHAFIFCTFSKVLAVLSSCLSHTRPFFKFKGINHQPDAWLPVFLQSSYTYLFTHHVSYGCSLCIPTSPSYPNITCNGLHIVFRGRNFIQHACMMCVPCPFPLFLTLWVTQYAHCVPNACDNQPIISFLAL